MPTRSALGKIERNSSGELLLGIPFFTPSALFPPKARGRWGVGASLSKPDPEFTCSGEKGGDQPYRDRISNFFRMTSSLASISQRVFQVGEILPAPRQFADLAVVDPPDLSIFLVDRR